MRRSGEGPTYLCSFGYRFRDRASALLVIISVPEMRLIPRHGSYLTSDLADQPTLRWLAFGHDELQLKLAKWPSPGIQQIGAGVIVKQA